MDSLSGCSSISLYWRRFENDSTQSPSGPSQDRRRERPVPTEDRAFGSTTVSASTRPDWTDEDVEAVRGFLDDNGIRVGEFSAFHYGFDHEDAAERDAAQAHYARLLRHGNMLDAHCVGFSTYGDRGKPGMWTEATWERCLDSVARLAEQAERAGMDVAAHPHAMAPLCSVERYREMLDRVGSPRLKVLIDIVNMTWPQRVFDTTALVDEVFDELGDDIVALHAKDVIISGGSGVSAAKGMGVIHVDEAVPGTGFMDFDAIVRRLDMLDHDVTVHVEHFDYEDTLEGQQYIRRTAESAGVSV